MPTCKDCEFFSPDTGESLPSGYCGAHAASLQKVSPDMSAADCPIKSFSPKKS